MQEEQKVNILHLHEHTNVETLKTLICPNAQIVAIEPHNYSLILGNEFHKMSSNITIPTHTKR